MPLDPVTVEVIGHHLHAIAEQMKRVIIRTALNPIINEVLDFSTGVFDARGRLAAQASGLSMFLGTLDWAVAAVIEKFGDDLGPGDVFLTNDPYAGGGTHLNDVTAVSPVFDEAALIGFVASRAHWTDVGGAVALSVQPDAQEIYGEGLVLPVVRIHHRGEVNDGVMEIIHSNVRLSEEGFGDLEAQLAAARIGATRLVELSRKYDRPTLADSIEELQDANETLTRQRLLEIPDGVYTGEDFLDDDGIGGPRTRIRVRAKKSGETLHLDFTESAAANPSAYNVTLCSLVSACRVILKCITDPKGPTNDGSFRPLTVTARPGTVVHATRPTAVSLYGEPARRAIDAVWCALAPVLPNDLPAGHFGTIAGLAMAGWDDRQDPPKPVTFQGPNAGGWGAGNGHQGESALCCITNGDTRNNPVEVIEATSPLLVRRYGLRTDSGGAGQWRGGLGTVYEFEVVTGGPFRLTCALGRTELAPFGVEGGLDGATNELEVWRGGKVVAKLARTTAFPLEKGDRVLLKTGGGGGYGDPKRRDRAAIEEDLEMGYITPDEAKIHYDWKPETTS